MARSLDESGLPASQRSLVKMLVEAIAGRCAATPFAVAIKGLATELIPGLSDIDFRLVVDTSARDVWRNADDACRAAYGEFARRHPSRWRVVEHGPGAAFTPDELAHEPACSERILWSTIWESEAGLVPPVEGGVPAERRRFFLRQFFGYRSPYDARRDPPINVAPEYVDVYPAYSICWHYYAPAAAAAARFRDDRAVKDKWDALRWAAARPGIRAATRVLRLAENNFRGGITGLAEECHADIEWFARDLACSDVPWAWIERESSTTASTVADLLRKATAWGRLYAGRYAFYADSPRGYELADILRIERSHIKTYLLNPVFVLPQGRETLCSFADRPEEVAEAVSFLTAQHRAAGDEAEPRATFAAIREAFVKYREPLERWYASL